MEPQMNADKRRWNPNPMIARMAWTFLACYRVFPRDSAAESFLTLSASIGVHRRLHFCFLALAAVVMPATAADWKPERNVEIVVGTSPGGGQDKTARLVQRILTERRLADAPVSVVNKPGGGGNLGWIYLNQHPADGHFLEIGTTTLLTSHLLGRSTISYSDVTPVAMLLS